MNLSFSLENASSFSPVPGLAMLVVLEPAVEEEAVVGSGAASASLRLSVIMAILGSQTDAVQVEKEKDQTEWVRFFFLFATVTDACQRQRARLVR